MENKNEVQVVTKTSGGVKFLIVILLLGLIGLGGFIAYDKLYNKTETKCKVTDNTKKNNTDTKELSYSYDDIEGVYKKTVTLDIEDEDFNKASYKLILYKNGTFRYLYTHNYKVGNIGNYIIKDNKIILNYLFSENSGVGLTAEKGTKTLIIESEKSITDENQYYAEYATSKSVTLEKSDEEVDGGIEDYINSTMLVNDFEEEL